ncbi:MAG: lipid-A-disaccharide synthase [Rhodocyclaceae bacterium]|nr:lipid-A-disaccharide synthase [Rhodocyclaceae bacterium]
MSLSPLCDLFVVAGEPSGDAYGAAIVRAVRAHLPDVTVAAMGGAHLAGAGADIEQDIDGMAVMGLWPVLARLPRFISALRRVEHVVRARRARVLLTIDYPGFNLRLARRLADLRRDSSLRIIHVVAPQVWAWRPRRAKRVARSVDRLLCFFPFEPAFFTRYGCRASYVGHPLVDLIPTAFDTARLDAEFGIAGKRLLLVAPGSREREVRALLPVLAPAAEAAARRCGENPAILVSRVPDLPRDLYRAATDLPLVEGRWRELCARAHVGCLASGTATLEAGLIGLPHVICYRMDPVTAACAKHLIRVPHVGLPNLVCGERVCPELLQHELTVPRLTAHLLRLWSGTRRMQCQRGLAELRQRLQGGALERIATIVADELLASPSPRPTTIIEQPGLFPYT